MLGLQPASHLGEYVMDGNGEMGWQKSVNTFVYLNYLLFQKKN